MANATVANANPTSMPLTDGAAARAGAGAGRAGAAGGAGAAGLAGAAGAACGAGAAGAAVAAAAGAGAAGAGILIDGPPAGLGGRLMRTVCFLAAASAGLGGSGAGAGGTGELGSAIGKLLADATEPQKSSQTVYSRERKKKVSRGRNATIPGHRRGGNNRCRGWRRRRSGPPSGIATNHGRRSPPAPGDVTFGPARRAHWFPIPATTSISTLAPRGSAETWTVERAGNGAGKNSA